MENEKLKIKSEFRKFCIENLKSNRYLFSKKIGDEIYKLAKKYKKILLFIPLKSEVDIKWVINRLRREKKSIFVPFMQDLSFKMVKYTLPLKKKRFSIFEPLNNQETLEKIDLAIVPIVGLDKDFRRIGFGKGMYDRFFAKLRYKPKVVFIQLRPCISNLKIGDLYDVVGDEFISFNIRRRNGMGFSRYDIIRSRGLFYNKKN